MREKVTALRARLGEALRSEFQAAQERGAQRLADGLAPYARFVRAEQERWDNVRATLTAWRGRAANLTTAVRRDRGATGDPEPTSGTDVSAFRYKLGEAHAALRARNKVVTGFRAESPSARWATLRSRGPGSGPDCRGSEQDKSRDRRASLTVVTAKSGNEMHRVPFQWLCGHRGLHVFQRVNGNWQVVASAQVPIPRP